MTRVAIISKTVTSNLGNQALTVALRRIGSEVTGQHADLFGRPAGLGAIRLERSGGPLVASLDRWTRHLERLGRLALMMGVRPEPAERGVTIMKPGSGGRGSPRQRAYAAAKDALGALALPDPRFLRRMVALLHHDVILYSGAGEVGDYSPFLRESVELRVLKSLRPNTRIWLVNCSVVVRHPAAVDALRSLVPALDGAVVRGRLSVEALVAAGMPRNAIHVAPDTAFCSMPDDAKGEGAVGYQTSSLRRVVLVVSGASARESLPGWNIVLPRLHAMGFDKIIITSTDLLIDRGAARALAAAHPRVTLVDDCYDYQHYMHLVRGSELVISERMHAGVLALCAGVPAAFVERGVHKTIEQLELVRYPLPVIDPSVEGWPARLEALVESGAHRRLVPEVGGIVSRARDLARQNITVPLGLA